MSITDDIWSTKSISKTLLRREVTQIKVIFNRLTLSYASLHPYIKFRKLQERSICAKQIS